MRVAVLGSGGVGGYFGGRLAATGTDVSFIARGRPLELPWLSGAIVRIGREAGVDTPIHRFITTVLQPHVNGRAPR